MKTITNWWKRLVCKHKAFTKTFYHGSYVTYCGDCGKVWSSD